MEIEMYWMKGKRDKDGNAQAACPQFEAQTISKAALSVPEPPIDEEELVNAWYIGAIVQMTREVSLEFEAMIGT